MIKRKILGIAAVLALAASAMTVTSASADASTDVVPIDWANFTAPYPTDSGATLQKDLFLNAVKYGLNDWYNVQKNFDAQTGEYIAFGGITEHYIRPVACEAYAIVTALKTGVYDPAKTGKSVEEAEAIALKLIRSVARAHLANTAGGWGNAWQSSYWSGVAGFAAWMMWDDLTAIDRDEVQKMIAHEADRITPRLTTVYQDRSGAVIRPGDSAAEENAWDTLSLYVASAMMPNHPNAPVWERRALELSITSYSQRSDLTNSTVVNGSKVSDWINGSNALSDATVINHGRIHPAYAGAITQNLFAPPLYTLSGREVPQAVFFNADKTYESWIERNFPTPTYSSPGGTVYVPGTGNIYYPQGNDWGTGNYELYNVMDSLADSYGLDDLVTVKAPTWEQLHGAKVAAQQARSTNGRTYINTTEDSYPSREEKVAYELGLAVFANWVTAQSQYAVTNAAPTSMRVLEGEHATPVSNVSGGVYLYYDVNASGGVGMGSLNKVGDGATFHGVAAGTSIDFTYVSASVSQLSLYIDGTFTQKVSFPATGAYSGVHATTRAYVTVPEGATVTLKLDTGDINAINLDKITIGTPVNDQAPGVTYAGTWTDNNSAASRYMGDEHYTKTAGASVSVSFTGTSVTWLGVRSTNRGNAKVYLDGVLQATVDQYGSTATQQELYKIEGLTDGAHVLKIVCAGTKRTAATAAYIDADYFIVK